MPTQKLEATQVIADLQDAVNKLSLILEENQESPEIKVIQDVLATNLESHQKNGFLGVTLVGPYSAGKSTIVSALTNRRDIKIDANIATDQVTEYLWNGIKIVDTPGLFTERQDHDDITYEAITKSDLLIFCLTYMLFDSVTVENFKKLAYEKGYAWKMMIVVNKMSDEAGEDSEKIKNYREGLATALYPYSLDDFPLIFIDAKDYCEGVEEDDEFLVEVSRFETLIEGLNQFVQERESLARLDTPIRITLEAIDDTEFVLKRNKNEDSLFFQVLRSLNKTVKEEQKRFRLETKAIQSVLKSSILAEGSRLSFNLTPDEPISTEERQRLQEESHQKINHLCATALEDIQEVAETSVESLQKAVQQFFGGDLVQLLLKQVKVHIDLDETQSPNFLRISDQMQRLAKIGKQCGASLEHSASNSLMSNLGLVELADYELSSIDVYGSTLHQTIRGVGEFMGHDFAWFEAAELSADLVNFATDIGDIAGNFLDFFIPIATIGSIYQMFSGSQQEDKLSEARLKISNEFRNISNKLEKQINQNLAEVDRNLFGLTQTKITEAWNSQKSLVIEAKDTEQEISSIRNSLTTTLKIINSSI